MSDDVPQSDWPRNLEPTQIAMAHDLLKGVIIALPDPKAENQVAEILRFQYNPETITRMRTGQWEHRLDKKGKLSSAQAKQEMDNHRGGLLKAKSEIISMKLVFDALEAIQREPADRDKGVLPEIAMLERLALGPDQKPEPKKDDNEYALISLNPTEILLVLGPRRFPAVVTSLNIVEQRFSPMLAPIRAECEIRLRVLEATKSATNKVIAAAYEELENSRANWAMEATWIVSSDDFQSVVKGALARPVRLDPTRPQGGE